MYCTLTIDSGNTNIKWGLFVDGKLINRHCVSCKRTDLLKSEFILLSKPQFIIISHVAHSSTKTKINEIISIWPSDAYWLNSDIQQCGVRNGYVNPQQLGSDRWAALIAAWNLNRRSCLVINVGTAMTIDALSDSGDYLGGIIIPSTYLLTKCLTQNTQLQNTGLGVGVFDDFPVNTQDAIYSGAIQALVGAIDRIYHLLASKVNHTDSICIISGGGAHAIIPYLKHPYKFIDCLVLNGLFLIAEQIRQNQSEMILST